MLNKQKGNMYKFVTHTWNPVKGKCGHDCSYCYMKVFPQGELNLDEKSLNDNLGKGNFIFVGSSTDMFAPNVQADWIHKVLEYCNKFPENTYLFQTKNPRRLYSVRDLLPKLSIIGTTIETNRMYPIYSEQVFSPRERAKAMSMFNEITMVTIEPIMDFDLDELVFMIRAIQPKWVNIGADSKNHKLEEPSKDKIELLIKELRKFTKVYLKDNLKRLQ